MPYHLEKGPTLRILELHLNRSRDEMRHLLGRLRASQGVGAPAGTVGIDWLVDDPATGGVPSWWSHPAIQARDPAGGGRAIRDQLIEKWFGWSKTTTGWKPPDPGAHTTGYWIAYRGDVEGIVRRALTWTFELALGLEPGDEGPGHPDPWTIELFWKCPSPWFEAWVVPRPAQRLVTLTLVTPSHRGSNVSETPLAASETTTMAGLGHPVPSTQRDYAVLGTATPPGAAKRRRAMWVVTHSNHVADTTHPPITTNTVESADLAEWGIPQLNIYVGSSPVVVVSPSMEAGGVREDGSVS
jgi:hypothetical protein